MHNLAWNGTECFVVSISNCDDDITSVSVHVTIILFSYTSTVSKYDYSDNLGR